MAIPGTEPEWDKNEVNSVAPDTDHEDEGWLAPGGIPEKPPFETFNHWMNNVYKWVTYFTNEARRLWQNQAVTHNMTADSSYTLTADQNSYGRVIITDSGVNLTTGRNIVVDVSERSFLFQNDTLQILTVKTTAGTGIAVAIGAKVALLCDGTDVIESVGSASVTGVLSTDNFFQARHQVASGVASGAANVGTQTRILDTVITNSIPGASLLANQITLPAGTYYAEGMGEAFQTNQHKLSLRNITDAITEVVGASSYATAVNSAGNVSQLFGMFTIAAPKVLELQQFFAVAAAGNGLGVASSSGEVEVYADIRIWKVD
mgnify:CR=1 FL=1